MTRWALARWFAAFASFSVPQAAAPIAFALLALPLTGDPNSGAAMILAMTVAQLAGAVPLARFGRGRHPIRYLKALVLIRGLALSAVALLAAVGAPFATLLVAVAVAGLVNGAAYGFLRAVLNHMVSAGKLPRALGVAATLNELVFVSAPIVASALGAISPVGAVLLLTLLGSAPLVLLPRLASIKADAAPEKVRGRVLTPRLALWLLCAVAMNAAVGAIEIGAVALAISFGFDPELGFIFPVALCVAAVSGGLWVTLRNRRPAPRAVIVYLTLATCGAVVAAWDYSVVTTLAAALLIGFFLPLLATYFQLVLDELSPADRRAEVFAMLRNANSIGLITISLTLTLWSLQTALTVAALLIVAATSAVAVVMAFDARHAAGGRSGQG